MLHLATLRRATLALALTVAISSALSAANTGSFRKRLAAASSSIKDIRGTMVIVPADKSEAAEINKGVLQFLDHGFREASIHYKRPDKFRIEGKAKGIDITYILTGNKKQVIAPALMLKKTEDLADDLNKKQTTLDVGFVSDTLWRDRHVSLVSESKGMTLLKLVPKGTDDQRKELIWVDTKTFKLLKRERYGGDGNLKARYIYSGHKTLGKVQVATLVKAYASDGGYAGTIKYENIRANTGVSDSLFALK